MKYLRKLLKTLSKKTKVPHHPLLEPDPVTTHVFFTSLAVWRHPQ